ncbi:MucBP domain-containing protein, partial [Streptococcus suis]|uniref:YSIRK-type signal peptide-containing protein n=1 Tax=Streptococcus suis TaxID=1307 RepID=UPI001ABE9B42
MKKQLFDRKDHFSLRKFKQGLASVALGSTFLFLGSYSVSAAETTASQPAADITETPVATQPATATASSTAATAGTTPIEDYHISESWELTDNIADNQTVAKAYINNDGSTSAYSGANTVIRDDYGNEVAITAKLTPSNGTPEGIALLADGTDQSSYGATSDMFVGNPLPIDIPALGIMTQPAPNEGNGNLQDKWNFNGANEEAVITFTFSKEVTNPILDISGLGGNARSKNSNAYGSFAKGSFNNSVLEVITDGIRLETLSGVNLIDDPKKIAVAEQNTYHRAVLDGDHIAGTSGSFLSPSLVPAGTGSIRLNGTFKEVSFKLYHRAVPFSAFPSEEYGTGRDYFNNTGDFTYGDGVNGHNRHWTDPTLNNLYKAVNNDLFRLSFRLPSGSVLVRYEDTEGNELAAEEIDTPTSLVGTDYDTTDLKKPRITTPAGDTYVLTAKEIKDGSAPENGVTVDGQLVVTYVYEKELPKTGDVVARYVLEGTETELAPS